MPTREQYELQDHRHNLPPFEEVAPGGGGSSDHGSLFGLADDDHPHYLTVPRGDARYYTETEVDTALAGKAAASHGHVEGDVNGLTAALAGKASSVHSHSGLAPAGGTTGQALKKNSNTDYDYSWQADATGGGGGGEAFPIGSVFIAVVPTDPATLLGYGTWSAFAAGRVLVGLDPADPDFDAVEETGGAKTHTLTIAEMPSHTHPIPNVWGHGTGVTADRLEATNGTNAQPNRVTSATGGGGAHNNVQPYIVVYMWKRTA